LRADITDNFETLHRTSSDRMIEQLGTAGKLHVDSYERENLNDFIRKQYLKEAIRALAQNGSADDRSLIDSQLDSADAETAPFIAEFLGKYGKSSDARTLLSLYEKSWSNKEDLLPLAVKLSENPSQFLFDLSLSGTTRAKIIRLVDEDQILAVRSDWLGLLNDPNAEIRKAFISRIFTLTSPRERKKLIDTLLTKITYYYDAIYWLDRLSYPTKRWQMLFAESLSKHLNNPYRRDWLREQS